MPRLQRSTNSPKKPLTARMERIRPFMPCFFDVPLKHVLKILRISHQTMRPIREEMGLEEWPMSSITRGDFCTHKDVCTLRAEMMPLADADMQRILCRMDALAETLWDNENRRRQKVKEEPLPSPSEDPVAQDDDDYGLFGPWTPKEEQQAERNDSGLSGPWTPQPADEDAFWQDLGSLLTMMWAHDPQEGACPQTVQ